MKQYWELWSFDPWFTVLDVNVLSLMPESNWKAQPQEYLCDPSNWFMTSNFGVNWRISRTCPRMHLTKCGWFCRIFNDVQMVASRYLPNLSPDLGFGTVNSFGRCCFDTGLSPVFPISKPFGSCFATFFSNPRASRPSLSTPDPIQGFYLL